MSNTPKTDAFITSLGYSPTEHQWRNFSRKLERERDEAHKIAGRAIDDLAWFNETNAERLRSELNQIKEGAK
jgi:hypothetical protein